jgi:hypothetical protein
MSMMPGILPGLMQLITPEPATTAAVMPDGEQATAGGFSALFSEKRSALHPEKPLTVTTEAEPAELAVSTTQQQIMAAFAVAAQMNAHITMTPAPLPVSSTPDVTKDVSQEIDSIQNVPVIPATPQGSAQLVADRTTNSPDVADTPEAHPVQPSVNQQPSGRNSDVTLQPNQVVALVQNVPTPVAEEVPAAREQSEVPSARNKEQFPGLEHQQTVNRMPDVTVTSHQDGATVQKVQTQPAAEPPQQPEQPVAGMPNVTGPPNPNPVTVSGDQNDQVQVIAKPVISGAVTAAASEPVTMAPPPGTVAQQIMHAAYQAEVMPTRMSMKQPLAQNVPTSPTAEQVVAVPATPPRLEQARVTSPHTVVPAVQQQDVRPPAEPQQPVGRMPEVSAQTNQIFDTVRNMPTTPTAPVTAPHVEQNPVRPVQSAGQTVPQQDVQPPVEQQEPIGRTPEVSIAPTNQSGATVQNVPTSPATPVTTPHQEQASISPVQSVGKTSPNQDLRPLAEQQQPAAKTSEVSVPTQQKVETVQNVQAPEIPVVAPRPEQSASLTADTQQPVGKTAPKQDLRPLAEQQQPAAKTSEVSVPTQQKVETIQNVHAPELPVVAPRPEQSVSLTADTQQSVGKTAPKQDLRPLAEQQQPAAKTSEVSVPTQQKVETVQNVQAPELPVVAPRPEQSASLTADTIGRTAPKQDLRPLAEQQQPVAEKPVVSVPTQQKVETVQNVQTPEIPVVAPRPEQSASLTADTQQSVGKTAPKQDLRPLAEQQQPVAEKPEVSVPTQQKLETVQNVQAPELPVVAPRPEQSASLTADTQQSVGKTAQKQDLRPLAEQRQPVAAKPEVSVPTQQKLETVQNLQTPEIPVTTPRPEQNPLTPVQPVAQTTPQQEVETVQNLPAAPQQNIEMVQNPQVAVSPVVTPRPKQNVSLSADNQQPIGRIPEEVRPSLAPSAEVHDNQNVAPVPVSSAPTEVEIAVSLSRPVTSAPVSAASAARTATAARGVHGTESVRNVQPQQAVAETTTTDTQNPATETVAPFIQPVPQQSSVAPETMQTAPVEDTKTQKSHSESAAVAVELLNTKQQAAQVEQPVAAVAEQTELAASAVTDTRSTLGQRALRGVAVQLDQKTAVENVQPRTQQTATVKEMTTVPPGIVTAGDASGSNSSLGRDGEQAGSNQQADSQTMTQPLFTPQKTEHQQAPAAKVSAEPVRQELPEQIAQQVRERLTQHELKPGHQQISLTLSPENLGEVKMNLSLQGQRLTVEIVTDNRIARDAIMQHADTLKETLARQNITMESFDVTTGGKGSGNNQGQNQNAWQELAKKQQQQQLWTSPRGYTTTAQADLPSGAAAYQSQKGRSMLDIHY